MEEDLEPFVEDKTNESEPQSFDQNEQTFPDLLPAPVISDQKNNLCHGTVLFHLQMRCLQSPPDRSGSRNQDFTSNLEILFSKKA